MFKKPDYTVLISETKFRWQVGSAYTALLDITGIPIKEFNLDPAVGIELYRKGRRLLREMFGPDIGLPGVSTPPISYGHVNGLGAELIFPEDGEVNHSTLCGTLKQGIEILKKPVIFETAGMAPFYLEYRRKMQAAFPDEPVGFGYGYEGPMTTAYTLRRDAIFYDPFDNPELTKEFLRLTVESIIEFVRFQAKVMNRPAIDPIGSGMCDDLSSMFSPGMWHEFVLPYIHQYYEGKTTGIRSAHIEDLRPDHLPFLEDIGLVYFDPSISPKINPAIIRDRCRVPFGWRLGSFHYHNMTCQDVQDFVFQAVADGACRVFTYVGATMCNDRTAQKVHAFIDAAREAERMLNHGASLEAVRANVSAAGRKKFWEHWLD
ncbi:hypothetical protein JXJ21_25145 [candidate division KSB1 bacterium]|nr:hypothetical protein [candidate division KSB1 bacterium]